MWAALCNKLIVIRKVIITINKSNSLQNSKVPNKVFNYKVKVLFLKSIIHYIITYYKK